MSVVIQQLQESAPIGGPVRAKVENIGGAPILAFAQVVMGGQKVPGAESSSLRIHKTDLVETGYGSREIEKVFAVQPLVKLVKQVIPITPLFVSIEDRIVVVDILKFCTGLGVNCRLQLLRCEWLHRVHLRR